MLYLLPVLMTTSSSSHQSNKNWKLEGQTVKDLAMFKLQAYDRARELQYERTGLLSNANALRIACFKVFAAGLLHMKTAVEYVRLLGGVTRDEQLETMRDYANLAANYSSKDVALIIQSMLENFASPQSESHDNAIFGNPENSEPEIREEYPVRGINERDECTAP